MAAFGSSRYFCPSCHLHLLSWDEFTKTVEMFHKVSLWRDTLGSGQVRLICQYCEGATEPVPDTLVTLLQERYALAAPSPRPRRS